MKQIIECIPNFSEGRDMQIIRQITGQIECVEGVRLLDVYSGKSTNRTVVTFAGEPVPVLEAAFRAVRKASRLIDMSRQKGVHPRFGATDVCPLVPVCNISMDETAEWARKLAERIGSELGIPVYCYGFAALDERRKNLSEVRSGEYEALEKKLVLQEWKPDFGPAQFLPRTGAIAVGARDFLVAYNINLNTTSSRIAGDIASEVRERGRMKRKGDVPVRIPGSLKAVRAIGWYIEEYELAQISMNLTDISLTPLHVAFEEVREKAGLQGIKVSGSEIVGLVPLEAMLDAGRYFLKKQQRCTEVPDAELIKTAVRSLGLDAFRPFQPDQKIIEYMIQEEQNLKLCEASLRGFMEQTASESPVPGGGSVSAAIGSLGAALGTMVASISSQKRGWEKCREEFRDWAEKGRALQEELMGLVDEDARSFKKVLEARQLPRKTGEEAGLRKRAFQEAMKQAILVPFRTMETAAFALELLEAMVRRGNPGTITDAGVGVIALQACVRGSFLTVRANAKLIEDRSFTDNILEKGRKLLDKVEIMQQSILSALDEKIK